MRNRPADTTAELQQDPVPRTTVNVGRADEFPEGQFKVIKLVTEDVMPQDREIGILRAADGKWHAVRNICPHRGGSICRGEIRGTMLPSAPGEFTYGLDGKLLVCPWHHHEFDLETGQGMFIEAAPRLVKYPIDVEDGQVRVQLLRAQANTD